MTAANLLIVIPVVTASIVAIIGAIFTGWIALKQLPQVHALVNRNFSEQKAKIEALQSTIADLQNAAILKSDTALTKAETRAGEHPQQEP